MAVSTTDTHSGPFTANGITVEFPFSFKAASAAELRVFILDVDGIEQPVASDRYSVSLGVVGGSVIFGTAPAGGDLYIESDPLFLQQIAFSSGQPYRPETVNEANDRAAIRDLVLKSGLDRSLKVPIASDVTGKVPVVLPDKTWGFQDVPDAGVAESPIPFVALEGQTDFNLGDGAGTATRVERNGSSLSDFTQLGSVVMFGTPCHAGDIVMIATAQRTLLPGVAPANVMGIASRIPTFPAILNLLDMGSRRADVRDWNGMDLTGSNDCTPLIQDGANQATAAGLSLDFPACRVAVTSTIDLPDGGILNGLSGAYQADSKTAISTLHMAHGGTGVLVDNPSGSQSIKGIGFLRDQPVPGPGWTPNDHDFDILVSGDTDFVGDDLLFINSTRGISFTNGGGRHLLSNIRGQPFRTGIDLEYSADVTRIWGGHFWDFWSSHPAVIAWMMGNGTAFYSKRNDNADLYSLFSIFYRHGFRIGRWAGGGAGTTKRLRVFGYGADACGSGVTVDSDANGCTAEFHGLYAHGHDDIITDGSLIDVNGTNGDLRIYGKTDLSNAHRNAVRVVGAGHSVTINDLSVGIYNKADGGHAALWVDPAAYGLTLRGEKAISGGVNGAPIIAGGGKVRGMWLDYQSTVSAGGGAMAPANFTARYLVSDNLCRVKGMVEPGGGGTTDIRITLPFACSANGNRVGAIKTSTGAKSGTIQPLASSSTAVMNLYDGSYPGGAGIIYFDLEYEI